VLLVGAIDFHEFDEAVRWLRAHTQLDAARTATEALEQSASRQAFWHTIIIAQSRPGQFAPHDIDQLSRAMPLAHLIALLGSCCEGETRSGRPWPGVVRVYWHQFAARAATELRMDVTATSWQLPRTVSDAERADHALQGQPQRAEGLIAIRTQQAVFFDALARACRIAGYSTVWTTSAQWWSVQGAVAVLWHSQLRTGSEFEQLRDIAARARQVPVIALLSFPRYDHVQRATAAGAAAVLSIPFLLPDLWTTLREVAP
jgi:CheY-like chemotaxis protein